MNEDAGVLGRLMRADELEEQGRWEEAAWTRLTGIGSNGCAALPGGDWVWAWTEEAGMPLLYVYLDGEAADVWQWDGQTWSFARPLQKSGHWWPWVHAPCPPCVRAAVEAACRVRTEALFARGEPG